MTVASVPIEWLKSCVRRQSYLLAASILFIAVGTLLYHHLPAQENRPPKNIEKALTQAQKKIDQQKYSDALAILHAITLADSAHGRAHFLLGIAYYKIRDYLLAERHFKMAYDIDKISRPLSTYYYALMLKMRGHYREAKSVFESFLRYYQVEDKYRGWAKVEIQGCDMAMSKPDEKEGIVIRRLGAPVNSHYSEMGPVFWDDTTLLFATLPHDTTVIIAGQPKWDYHLRFYLADYKNDSFYNVQRVDDFFISSASVASGCLSPDRTRFYLTGCSDYAGPFTCHLYVSRFRYGRWNEPERLDAPVNDLRYSSAHPTIALYKKGKQIMYFSSDRPGGKGGKDIWYCIIEPDGRILAPVNAGAVNTSRDEITPFYDNLTGTLYFSSDGHAGYGGFDVFRAVGEKNVWMAIENLGMPVNSSVDELYFSYDSRRNLGLLVSNRPEKEEAGATCCDDIFLIKYTKPSKLALMGYIKVNTQNAHEKLQDVRLSLTLIDSAGHQLLLKEKTVSAAEPYYFLLASDRQYLITASGQGFFTKTVSFNTIGRQAPDTIYLDIVLEKMTEQATYRLSNVYYKYNDYTLLPEAKATLDTLYELLQENPELVIEISSHTDSRGSMEYNLTLSEKRAQSCVNYLISKGIAPSRLIARGYGATRPLQNCDHDITCGQTEKEDCACHQLNRRTEFKIISIVSQGAGSTND